MRSAIAFTLIELLAVIGIMLILMTATFGVLSMLAQQTAPEAAVSTLQAMLNSARDYAASNGVDTRVVFSVDSTKGADGTTMALQYYETDPAKGEGWNYARGRKPFAFHDRIYICKGMPSFVAGNDYDDPGTPLNNTMNAAQKAAAIEVWNKYRQQLLLGRSKDGSGGVNNFALANGTLRDNRVKFNVDISPTGYMNTDVASTGTVDGFTVVQLGGTRVVGYVFYPLNPNNGTRLLFE